MVWGVTGVKADVTGVMAGVVTASVTGVMAGTTSEYWCYRC